MKRGRRPRLTDEERHLWDQVRRTATPLNPDATPPDDVPAAPPPAPPEKPEAVARKAEARPRKPQTPVPPSAGGFDRKTMSRLTRGVIAVDARIDLHGLTQDAAHHRLLRFLDEARAEGAKIVLVITGKGAPEAEAGFGDGERGILRRAVPDWLTSPAFRNLVSGYEGAGRRHGGGGALYVRLRRKCSHHSDPD